MVRAREKDFGDFGIITGKILADIMSDTEAVYYWRGGSVVGLSRDYLGTFFEGVDLEPGDRIIIGDQVVEAVSWHGNWLEGKRVIVDSVEE